MACPREGNDGRDAESAHPSVHIPLTAMETSHVVVAAGNESNKIWSPRNRGTAWDSSDFTEMVHLHLLGSGSVVRLVGASGLNFLLWLAPSGAAVNATLAVPCLALGLVLSLLEAGTGIDDRHFGYLKTEKK
uniref:Uncharacterized protein n=1 Tax=Eutreptiella gymnastica TaxID=73025 RepID=A0A7S1J016_9EUGL